MNRGKALITLIEVYMKRQPNLQSLLPVVGVLVVAHPLVRQKQLYPDTSHEKRQRKATTTDS
jgi:hypothetical protein